jgi:hypothetical protein
MVLIGELSESGFATARFGFPGGRPEAIQGRHFSLLCGARQQFLHLPPAALAHSLLDSVSSADSAYVQQYREG